MYIHVLYENAMTRIVRSVQKKQVDMTFDGCILLGSGYLATRRAGTWSIEDHWHEPVRFPGFRSSEMGSMQLLWFCQEAEMDVLDREGKFEELMALKEDEEKELAAIETM